MVRPRQCLSLLVIILVAAAGACTGPKTDTFTQGGGSMEPTVRAGQVITVREVGPDDTINRGDIVLFHPSGGRWGDSKSSFLKRVIAVGGDTIACCDYVGAVTVNGTRLDEPYVTKNSPLDAVPNPTTCVSRRFEEVKLDPDTLFVMGDNRVQSNDSRCQGPIPVSSVFAVMTT